MVGAIGSGKSYVAKQFGYPVFNADFEVSKIYKKNKNCFVKLRKKLPKFIYSFPIKKLEILNAIESNWNNLKKINKIVHPIVRKKMNYFLIKNKDKKIVILDIPLLLENKINIKDCILLYVDANKIEIKKRLKDRINFNEKLLKKLNKLQLPIEIKKNKSNYIIKNDFKISSIKKNVTVLKKKILRNERNST